ncbi:short-chain dehydrogenase/reductase family protein [Cavenderia fasciculata]|uniref:Short-chain dehydrogenase/reductase family protein n=1 Tax=Cavenderia fasciculata TaxID=261658 RepID=F4PYA0_CACFS|nr:short-chain dehydrogenase/reductase family protein [Cavenderia fasciculata]EGG19367.1 short-chain dehydrogenase/reductase family protein [Cavenderia fasciculata]|eukprot:XP_004357638.1 short-chain dehydrogenase/reductase family protein [Cavenderia fasciculata]
MISSQIYYVTGASKGIGKKLVERLLLNGDKVVATSRDKKQLNELFGQDNENFLALQVDLANEESVKKSVEQSVQHFGTLDIIVNNAGYGFVGSVEESTNEQVKENFDINFYGTLNVIRHALPILRTKRQGLFINVSSLCAFYGFAGCGIYSATKAAVDLLTESLQQELIPFNVKAITINPGYFRTEFIGAIKKPSYTIEDYKQLNDNQTKHDETMHNNQRGDPNKLVDVVFEIVKRNGQGIALPQHIYIGVDSNEVALAKAKQIQKEIEEWSFITTKTDFDTVAAATTTPQ